MGAVFVAWDVKLQAEVAVKVLPRIEEPERAMVLERRFEAEARVLARLSDPRILRPITWGRAESGELYIVTELLQGRPLDVEIIDNGPLHPLRAARLLLDVCSALGEAHAAGVIHRDIKPGNIFIQRSRTGEEVGRLLDFGVAKVLDEVRSQAAMTRPGALVGTPAFMAPEQARGGPIDPRADIYSLGVVAYICLTCRTPFDGPPMAMLRAHSTSPVPPFRERAPHLHVDPELERLVFRLLEKEPADRPASATAVRSMLEAWLASSMALHASTCSRLGGGTSSPPADEAGDASIAGEALTVIPGSGFPPGEPGGRGRGPSGSSLVRPPLPAPSSAAEDTSPGVGTPPDSLPPYPSWGSLRSNKGAPSSGRPSGLGARSCARGLVSARPDERAVGSRRPRRAVRWSAWVLRRLAVIIAGSSAAIVTALLAGGLEGGPPRPLPESLVIVPPSEPARATEEAGATRGNEAASEASGGTQASGSSIERVEAADARPGLGLSRADAGSGQLRPAGDHAPNVPAGPGADP